MRLSINEYRKLFRPMPSVNAVKQWALKGRIKLHQPGGRGCTMYVEEVEEMGLVDMESEMSEAMRATRKEAS